ncbi:hypothetical protein V4842_08170 [Pseudomonas moraviensis]
MIKYKRNSVLLKVVCAVLISTPAFADEKKCQFHDLGYKMDVVGCSYDGSVSVLKLAPIGQTSYETNLENIPTFIVSGDDLSQVLDVVGGSDEAKYNKLISLPYPEAILNYEDASSAAKGKLLDTGWKLLDMKDVVYEGQGGEEGAGVVCTTLEKKIDTKYVAVSQCNSFYNADITGLKKVLDLLSGNK